LKTKAKNLKKLNPTKKMPAKSPKRYFKRSPKSPKRSPKRSPKQSPKRSQKGQPKKQTKPVCTRRNSKSLLKGGLFKGKGSYGCGFLDPLATTSATGVKAAGARLGKIMTAKDAEIELVAMRPFIALDPKGQWGVYASDVAPLHVDLTAAVESAGGKLEFAKCDLYQLESARRIASEAHEKPPGKERQDFVTSEIDKITKTKQQYAELEKAVKESKEPDESPTKLLLTRASRDFFSEHHGDIAFDGVDQLEFSLASAGDMETVIDALQNDERRPDFSVALIQAHLVAFSNLTRGLMVYHVGLLVHRDIKPPNIVLASGTPDAPGEYKFIDFGMSLPLSKAAIDNTQAGTYVYWPMYTNVAFSQVAYKQTHFKDMPILDTVKTKDAILAELEKNRFGTHWRPSWTFTESVYNKATNNLDKLVIHGSLGAVAALHADMFGLYVMTLSCLYRALTGVRFTVDETLTTLKPDSKGFAFASTALGGRVSTALGQLVLDVSVGVVTTAGAAAGRFQSVLDMFSQEQAPQLVAMLENSRVLQKQQAQWQPRPKEQAQVQAQWQPRVGQAIALNPFRK
jgi:hypothetical protein